MTRGPVVRRRSLVREACGLDAYGGLVVLPDEFMVTANALGLSAAERLTLVGLMRAWNPRRGPPVVSASLQEIRVWSGLSLGQQSDVLAELLTGFDPPLLEVVAPAAGRTPRKLSFARFLRLLSGASWTCVRVRSAERKPAFGPPKATGGSVRSAESVASGPPKPVASPRRCSEELQKRARALDDDKLREMLTAPKHELHEAARLVWLERRRARNDERRKASGGGTT